MGSKARIAKHILPVMLKAAEERGITTWVEPFVGGANMIDKVPAHFTRIGVDNNYYLIAMWKSLQGGWVPPSLVTEDEYQQIKSNPGDYTDALVGFVGFNLSFGAKWFAGYRRDKAGQKGDMDNMINQSRRAFQSIVNQTPDIQTVQFHCGSYYTFPIPNGSLIYCDPPYAGTTKYKDGFDHSLLWDWVRDASKHNTVFVSEYNAPPDFECIWSGDLNGSLSLQDTGGSKSKEKLFIFKP